eukprot:CAMPEP_0176285302 /NCGR_PEP_ID=MMETSP0121_2-20121125/52295_1 /TAXON_ID=160619 /ORGANISM="Kryptoperidinium foliaceum, Strain CCMP 1326" /LENGTH=199 /DNA_ID=CAMNT_0017625773 /DNA_START=63 /DNA_END=662 /DNA_ORIENTATION=+
MKTLQLSLVSLLPLAAPAFHLEPVLHQRTATKLYASVPMDDRNTGKITYPKQEFPFKQPDMERAKDCAEHVGKCSVKELKELREGLHQKRIQEAIFGDDVSNPSSSTAPEDIFQERILEEELSLQLNLLHDEMPPPYLFTPNEHPFEETDDMGMALAAQVKEAEQTHVFEELAEEGVMESLAICALISVLMIAPQFFLR